MGPVEQNKTDESRELLETPSLEDQLPLILDAVEAEPVPQKLTKLATDLQAAVEEQRHKRTPN